MKSEISSIETNEPSSHLSINGACGNAIFFRRLPAISHCLESVQKAVGLRATGIIIAITLLAIAAIYVTPAFQVVNNGRSFADLSVNPFARTSNMFGNRILSPFLAYLMGLRGPNFI